MLQKYRALNYRTLLKTLDYNPISGEFRWKKVSGSKRHMHDSTIAGTTDKKGARVISINGYLYYAHRLAWFYVYRKWPNGDLDHKDLNPLNNAIENLRIATRAQNNANSRAKNNNQVGLKGVQKHGKKYAALITIKKRVVHLGSFKSPEQAHAAYLAKAKEAYGEFARGG